MSPVKAKVSTAVVSPDVTVAILAIDTFGISVTNPKLDAVTPLPKEVPPNVTLIVAPPKSDSVNGVWLVDVIDTLETVIVKLICARSALVRFESASCTLTTTVLEPAVVGVPQTVRTLEPSQSPVPSSSKISPAGRLSSSYARVPSPPVATGIWKAVISEFC